MISTQDETKATQLQTSGSDKTEGSVTMVATSKDTKPALVKQKSQKSLSLMKWLGFQQKYEFVLWSICSFFMAFFVLIRSPYLHFPTFQRESSPGEWYWFKQNPYHFSIFLHLYSTLPAGFLAIIQFIPAIRNKAPFIHRYVGYAIMTLLTLGNISIAMISPISMGGNDLPLTAAIAFLIVATSSAMGLAWYNIRKQQIDEHRKWMLRGMFWMGIIVTMRLFMIMIVLTISYIGGYTTLWTCAQAQSVTGETAAFYDEFPACRLLGPNTYIGVPADLKNDLHIGSAVRLTFAMTTWLAISVHTLAVEVYIHLTPKENDRLRMISYRKQLALGLNPAGSAGLTADRLGSSRSWSPKKAT